MSARLTDDGGDQESAYCDWVAATALGTPEEFIVDGWLDEWRMVDDRAAKTADERLAGLRSVLLFGLRSVCTEFEIATNAARLGGEQSFDEWLEER